MTQAARGAQVGAWIDDYLSYLLTEWNDVPTVAAEWDEWADHEQLDFVVEWPIREDRLYQLQQWAEQDLLTPEQRSRYAELLKLVEQHRPALERLLAD